jgi:hypothetical protein
MAKDRPLSHVAAIAAWLRTGEGDVPEALRADAARARTAIAGREAAALASLAPEVQVAATEALATLRDPDTLVALEEATPHKEVRKAAGKALHLLRTKGLKVAEPQRGEGFRFHTVEGEEPRSYASLSDPEGDRMVWYGAQVKGRGRMAFQAVVNEVNGLVLFQVFPQMTAKMRRRILEELLGGKIPVYEVDNDYARWLVEEGIRRNRETGTEIPKDYFEAEPLMGTAPDLGDIPHPIYSLLMERDQAGEPSAAELRAGASLFELEQIQSWRPTGDIMERLLSQLNQTQESVLVLDDAQKREQFQSTFERASREYFTAEVRARWRRRLLDLAHHLVLHDRVPQARIALAVAEDLARDGCDPAQNPFALELFYKGLQPKETPEGEAKGEEDSDEAQVRT